jgi:hypothetical protein
MTKGYKIGCLGSVGASVLAMFGYISCNSFKEEPYNRKVWLSSDVRKMDNHRQHMIDSALQRIHKGDTKSHVLYILGEPTAREKKGIPLARNPSWPDLFWPNFEESVRGSGTLPGPNGRRIPDPGDVEIWSYYLGEYYVGESVTAEIRFNRKGLVTKTVKDL